MVLRSISPLRLRMVLAWLAGCLSSVALPCLAQVTFSLVDNTPYDKQMARVSSVLVSANYHASGELSLAKIDEWMSQLRAIPYQYSKEWKTPEEVQFERVADCKGKAVALYEKMRVNGEKNVRLIIGKRCAEALVTHAWLEWKTGDGNYILDPTFDSMATSEVQDGWTYIPFYAYEGAQRYQAILAPVVTQTVTAHKLESPSQGLTATASIHSPTCFGGESSDRVRRRIDYTSHRRQRRNCRLVQGVTVAARRDYVMQLARMEWQWTP